MTRPQLLPGIEYSSETGEYRAALDGLARFDGTSLEIRRQIVWDGDLTLHDNPIDFDGAVLIRGSLRDGARVQATEDIEITGGVEGATVISTGGAVNIRQGVVGRGRGFISAKTNVDARYFENATVYAQEEIISRHAVVHSRLTAGRGVRAELDKGTMFGGEIRAGMGVYTKSLGNATGIATIVAVGFDWETLSKLQEVEGELAGLRQRTARCEEIIAGFRRAKSNLAQLSLTERNALCAVLKRHLTLKTKIQQGVEHTRSLEAAAIQSGRGEIVCRENIYPGTVVKIGPAIAQIVTSMSACTITYNRESRKLVSIQPSGRTVPLATNG
jgi:uncharacterized protein (DUF342 family)